MDEFLATMKALSEKNRVRALMALRNGELCVCQMIELLGLAPSTVSSHMTILRRAGLVEIRRDGKWAYYRLNDGPLAACVLKVREIAFECLAADEQAREDARRLSSVREMPLEDLCRHYKN